MKPRNPPRRINSTQLTSSKTTPQVLYAGRAEQPTVIRGAKESMPWTLIGIIVVLVVAGALGSSKMFDSSFFSFSSASSYEQSYEVRNVELKSDSVFKGRARWIVTARTTNATRESLPGPRLRIRLLRADDTVAAEGFVDYGGRTLGELDGIDFSYQMETGLGETLHAEVSVVKPRGGR